jgi:hypothetical protein
MNLEAPFVIYPLGGAKVRENGKYQEINTVYYLLNR